MRCSTSISKTMIGQNGQSHKMSYELNNDFTDIILLDSSSKLDNLKNLLAKKNSLVITFDYNTHKTLLKDQISHQISDQYLTRDELDQVQKKSYDLVKWYHEPTISESIEYEGVNLGSLIEIEFNYFLVQFLKRYAELSKIFSKYHDKVFTSSSSLFDITSSFSSSVNKLDELELSDKKFYYDSIKIKFKLKNRYFEVNLSKSYYLKLKNTAEKITHLLFHPINNTSSKKTILLVEFDTVRYDSIFESSYGKKLNLVLFNRRRSAIWNLKSFSIIKKTGTKVATPYDVEIKEIENSIKSIISTIENKIEHLWNKEDYLKSFFSINGRSFWNIIKPLFIDLIKRRISEFIFEIELAKKLLQKIRPSSIVIWTETAPTEQIMLKLAKKMKIPIVLLQHGLFYDSPGARYMNKFQGVYPLDVDKYVVWGKLEADHAQREGVKKENIVALGSPLYDQINRVKKNEKNNSFILLATSGPVKEDSFDLTVEVNERNENTIKKICEIVSKLDKKLIIKLHPSPDEFDPTELAHKINPEIKIVQTGSITPLIESCEVLIVIDVSTVILDAQILGKPVISVSVKDSGWGIPTVLSSKSCAVTDMDNFEFTLERLLKDESFRNDVIQNGKKFANEYLVNQGSSSKELLNLLSKI